MEVLQKNKNHLLDREEVIVSITENIMPSKESMKEKLATHFKHHKDNVVIDKISGKFGTKTFTVHSKIYETIESKHKFEVLSKKQRDSIKKASEESAKKSAEKTEEKTSEGGSK